MQKLLKAVDSISLAKGDQNNLISLNRCIQVRINEIIIHLPDTRHCWIQKFCGSLRDQYSEM